MIEKIALTVFLTCAFTCGCLLITMIWVSSAEAVVERFVPTLFILGFFSFLVWGTRVVYRFLACAKS